MPGLSPCKSMIPICWKPWMLNCPTPRNPGRMASSQDDGETETWNTSKVEKKIMFHKKTHHTQPALPKFATKKIIKVLLSPLLRWWKWRLPVARTRSRCFYVVGSRFVFGSPRVIGALEQVQRRGVPFKSKRLIFVFFFHGLLLKLAPAQEWRNEGMKEWKNRACYHSNCAHYRSNRCHSNCYISAQKTETNTDYKCMNI